MEEEKVEKEQALDERERVMMSWTNLLSLAMMVVRVLPLDP